jgi:hypothetical protein
MQQQKLAQNLLAAFYLSLIELAYQVSSLIQIYVIIMIASVVGIYEQKEEK